MKIAALREQLRALASPEAVAKATRFFKTGPGQYGEGDQFLGINVPTLRKLAKEWRALSLDDTEILLRSPMHEERLLALFILVLGVIRCPESHRKTVYGFYCTNKEFVNNWDLVDSSAPAIVGGYLRGKSKKPIDHLAKSTRLWDRRIAIVATQHFIRHDEFDDTLRIAATLLEDPEDLIHKAAGWMLREVGDRDVSALEAFLAEHADNMPRTMLRYAIEHFSPEKRRGFLGRG